MSKPIDRSKYEVPVRLFVTREMRKGALWIASKRGKSKTVECKGKFTAESIARDVARESNDLDPAGWQPPAPVPTITHKCTAYKCTEQVPAVYVMCPRHWQMVPFALQKTVYTYQKARLQENTVRARKQWIAAVQTARRFVANLEGIEVPEPKPEEVADGYE